MGLEGGAVAKASRAQVVNGMQRVVNMMRSTWSGIVLLDSVARCRLLLDSLEIGMFSSYTRGDNKDLCHID